MRTKKNTQPTEIIFFFRAWTVGDSQRVFGSLRGQVGVIDVVDLHLFSEHKLVTRITQRVRVYATHLVFHGAQIVPMIQTRPISVVGDELVPGRGQNQTARRKKLVFYRMEERKTEDGMMDNFKLV